MNSELAKKLYERFPELYRQKGLPMSQTCMCLWMLSLALETMSVRRCEVCGKHGKTCSSEGGYWLKTVCKEHAALLKYGWKAEDRGNR
jgi:hypothetical protein